MEALRCTIPGSGVVHQFTTRAGDRFGVLVDAEGRRLLLVYGPGDPDRPAHAVALDADEADQVADVLHTRSLADRLASLERRVAEVAAGAK